jgi:hypothetical protein
MIFEIGITTVNSGKVLVNSRIQYDCSNEELISPKGSTLTLTQKQKFLGFATLKSVYGNDRSKCTRLQNVHQIAAKLREAGITAETTILSCINHIPTLFFCENFYNPEATMISFRQMRDVSE